MKRNVDLSENRIFTAPEEPTGLVKLLLDTLKVTKPWDFENNSKKIEDDVTLSVYGYKSLLAVGNKKERQIWKKNHACDTNQICDCCGQSIGRKPWDKNRCNCYSITNTSKIPWKF